MTACDAYTTKELTALLGLKSASSVIRRAEKEVWQHRVRATDKQGRPSHEWLIASMPVATRDTIAAAMVTQDAAPAPVTAASAPAVQTLAVPESPLAKLTEHQRETALARLAFVREIERAAAVVGKEKAILNLLKAASDATLAPRLASLIRVANDRYGDGAKRPVGLSRRRLYDWCAKYAKDGERGLAPRHIGKDMRMPAWGKAFLFIWQVPMKPSISDAYRQLEDTYTGKMPSEWAVRRWLKKLTMPAREAGRVTGNAMLHLRPYKLRRTDELWPTDIYTADGTTFDAEIQHPLHGQPWKPEITLVIDVATRRCVGLAIGEAENAYTVLDALRVACLWGGIPCILYVDNGPGYQNTIMAGESCGILDRLDIEMRNSIPGRPQGKGLMERAVQSICVAAAKRLPSCMHADMDGDAGKKVFKITRADLKKHGKSKLLPTFDTFRETILARVDEYNATPHTSLPRVEDVAKGKRRHMTPDEYWNSFKPRGFAQVPVPEQLRSELFMPGIPRKVRNGMVQLFSGSYFSEALADFHGDFVEVRYDIWDASRVYCWTTNGEQICTAELDGNAMDYFPMAQIEVARERRKNSQVSRLIEKVQRVAPGATVELPESRPTYTMMADSITKPEPVVVAPLEPVVLEMPEAVTVQANTAKRPVFTCMQDRYSWLMHNPDRWTDADHDWIARFVAGDLYADLHTYFEARCIAWPGFTQAAHK